MSCCYLEGLLKLSFVSHSAMHLRALGTGRHSMCSKVLGLFKQGRSAMTGQNASTVGNSAQRQRERKGYASPQLPLAHHPIYRPNFQKQTKRKLGIPEAEDFELRFCLCLSGTEKKKHKAKENKRKVKEKKGKERKRKKEKHE